MAVQARITSKLRAALAPLHLEVLNESWQHSVPAGSETHFRVVIVSERFDGQSRVQQHRMIHQVLDEELKTGVHALALQTIPSTKWDRATTPQAAASPQCLGGMKREAKLQQQQQNSSPTEKE